MNRLRSPKPIPDVKRVLIINPFGIGDALFITPVIRALKEHGVREIDLLLGSRTREVFEYHPFVNRIFEWDKRGTKGLKLIRLLWDLRSRRYQAMFDYSLGRQYSFLAWAIWGIPFRIGFDFKNRGGFLTHKVDLPQGYREKSIVEFYRELAAFLGVERTANELEFFLSAEDRQRAHGILNQFGILNSSFIIVAPGGGESWGKDARLKRWPVGYFAEFVRKMSHQYGPFFKSVLILGGKNEHFLGSALSEKLTDFTVHNLCGAVSIRTAGALMEHASLLVANDGGLVHMARALKTPMVALYGPVDPIVYGPYPPSPLVQAITNTGPECRPCYQNMRYNAACQHVDCLNTLTPDFVLETLKPRRFFEKLCARSV